MDVLVVCTANVARSPLAAAMLGASLARHGIAVTSAGTRTRPGVAAAGSSQQLALARGLDLSGHRSRRVTGELVGASDLVITMSEEQRDVCALLAVGSGDRVFTLREVTRLLTAADLTGGPTEPGARLAWAVERAHLARPVAPPPRGLEDVHDPIRDPWPAWVALGAVLDQLVGDLVVALGATPAWDPVPADPDAEVVETDGRVPATGRAREPRRRRLLGWRAPP